MDTNTILQLDSPFATLENVGGKGASLQRLSQASLPVPEGYHVTTEAYRRFIQENNLQAQIEAALEHIDPEKPSTLEEAAEQIRTRFMRATIPNDIASAIVAAYGDLSGTDPAVAVRSSATAEDLPEASFAGQQESFLNVRGGDQVLYATQKCWSSLWTARAIGYRMRQGVGHEGVALGVVIQRLVNAEVAGILFTVNPMNANADQALISAAWGLGDAIVGGRVDTDDIIVDKDTGELLRREIANKEIMTVLVDGDTEDQPVPENLRKIPALEEQDAVELTRLGIRIEKLFENPMDIEWAQADGEFAILQARPITTLAKQLVPPPSEWELPKEKGSYMRASIVDFMPDPLSPLFGTLGTRIYNEALLDMLADTTDSKREIFPDQLIVTIQDYAYMRVNYSLGEWWALLSKLAPPMPRLIRRGPSHFREAALPQYERLVRRLEGKELGKMTTYEIWDDLQTLIYAAMYHLAVLQVDTLGASAGSEGLFTALYNRLFKGDDDPEAPAFLMGFDTIPICSEKSLYDLAQWVQEHPALTDFLSDATTTDISAALEGEHAPEDIPAEVWDDWKRQLQAHLEAFGYILYDLDFSKPVPVEDPKPMLETMKMYLRGEGADPHERQQRLKKRREQATEDLLAQARGIRGWAVRKALGWARSLAEVREDSIASIGLAYPRIRALFKELGARVVRTGAIESEENIFWMKESEIAENLANIEEGLPLDSMKARIEDRKSVHAAEKKIMPPATLPPSDTYMGIPIGVFIPGEGGVGEGGKLKGVGASSGKITGEACVLHGPEDFDQMRSGAILVAKMTTPAWTPLFAMAGGVVTDIGGPLSHGSIVAREYGIPAVLGTAAATNLIRSGQRLTVDGDAGVVTIHEDNQ